ncbi:hypothetical protein [Leptospira neocaledonica]|uniref:Uncharacterized protein n=1 Tax=Leptospira neocaledonica TaxID=2023192 RepID=A0A2M9ZZG4_9LEPT|nr:hypothetical protein [Leptospira neocaledonica]PJZ77426.1 hypothetical protein CH365_07510 [Leptospira neocaledonica]
MKQEELRKLKHPKKSLEKEIKRKARRRFVKLQKERKKKKRTRVTEEALTYREFLRRYTPPNLNDLLFDDRSPFYFDEIEKRTPPKDGVIFVPKKFSLLDNEEESTNFLADLMSLFIFPHSVEVNIDYSLTEEIDLGAQVLLDIIILEIIYFYERRKDHKEKRIKTINGRHINNQDVGKMLTTVGSIDIFTNLGKSHKDIIPYKLRIHERRGKKKKHLENQKDIDTTELVDYVKECLARLNRELPPENLHDLCTVVGEILINAEEHSSNEVRYSIGYFQEKEENGKRISIFRLVIMNFGKTIYDKFKDPDCPNREIVSKMNELSGKFSLRKLLGISGVTEESLWTLYALQEGVTSVSTDKFLKRGNGSIRFIESFFNLRGSKGKDLISRLNIISGSTNIQFSGEYGINERSNGDDVFKVMSFNSSGNLEELPDKKYVRTRKFHFPGTLISARIQFE